MHARRLACFLLGLWLAGGLLMAWVTTQNLKNADRLLAGADPAATARWRQLGPAARPLMRYQASELNRGLMHNWENVQLAGGFLFLAVILFWSDENKVVLCGLALLLVLTGVERFVIGEETAALGRMLDFGAAGANGAERTQFGIAHSAYLAVEVTKWLVVLLLTGGMVFSSKRSGRSRHSRHQLDRVDKPNYGHVDR